MPISASCTVKLPQELNNRLSVLSARTRKPKGDIVREALNVYLEDLEDAQISLDRVADKGAKYLTTAELEKELGL